MLRWLQSTLFNQSVNKEMIMNKNFWSWFNLSIWFILLKKNCLKIKQLPALIFSSMTCRTQSLCQRTFAGSSHFSTSPASHHRLGQQSFGWSVSISWNSRCGRTLWNFFQSGTYNVGPTSSRKQKEALTGRSEWLAAILMTNQKGFYSLALN